MDALHVTLSHPLRSYRLEVDLRVDRETVALVGPSGAGKTSVLRAIAGLATPAQGVVRLGSETWLDTNAGVALPPERRSVGLVFQDYALFPHLTVEENVAFGGRARVRELLEAFAIEHLARVRPGDLSGGERQRVALARALAREPRVLLLDEPLAALDAQNRGRVRAELGALLRRLGLPTLVVTHDFGEASALADRVGVIVDGKIVQLGTAAELIASPASPFVADFTGANLLRGMARRAADGLTEVVLADGTRLFSADRGEGPVGAVVYPSEIALAREEPRDSTRNHVRGPITTVVPLGNRVRVGVGPLTAEVTAASFERLQLRPGDEVVASFKATGTRLVPLA
ncbi:MAG: ABC transporter ATP-binding protein [Actinomycetota bacterium]|nr:ABC transporter ATP-binding protein [Actinomycetota bacterium]